MNRLILFFVILMSFFEVLAQSSESPPGSGPVDPPSVGAPTREGFSESYKEGRSGNSQAVTIYMAVATAFMAKCGWKNLYPCAAALVAAKQAYSAGRRDKAFDKPCLVIVDCGGGDFTRTSSAGANTTGGLLASKKVISASGASGDGGGYQDLEGWVKDELTNSGIPVDFKNKTIKTPKGTLSFNDAKNIVDSKGGLKFSNDMQDEITKRQKVFATKLARLGRSSSLSKRDGSSYNRGRSLSSVSGGRKGSRARKRIVIKKIGKSKSSVAGLTRSLAGGSLVGVAADDLFQMIHRKYQAKRELNLFNEEVAIFKK